MQHVHNVFKTECYVAVFFVHSNTNTNISAKSIREELHDTFEEYGRERVKFNLNLKSEFNST